MGGFLHLPDRNPEMLDRAEAYVRQALALDPQVSLAHFGLARVLQVQGKPTEAMWEARRAIELNPSSYWAHLELGRSEMRLGRFEEAKRSFDQVQQLDPHVSMHSFWATRGTLHYPSP